MFIAQKTSNILSAFSCALSLQAQQSGSGIVCKNAGTYEELISQNLLKPGGEDRAFHYRIPTRFAFSFLGQNFYSISGEYAGTPNTFNS
ncbi:MAG: hypothetical protein FD123_635 [Bacteroidetes bacterium]|nr:MAG: hypothetical protein FD123_635 [Bacteroidota bacterium]